ncbi:hypothetical protein ACF3DV_19645 [Chlorogloeopsis fritschii PCC 9212]|nr:hypothetical protein [Chlorogloeopsis fritschii]
MFGSSHFLVGDGERKVSEEMGNNSGGVLNIKFLVFGAKAPTTNHLQL